MPLTPLKKQFQSVYIEKESLSSDVAQRALDLFPQSCIQILKDKSELKCLSSMTANQFDMSKRKLLLCSFKGRFFKRCPGARPGLICCNYFVLNLGQHCEMNCSYCYLQNLINFPFVVIYTNIEQALKELDDIAETMGSIALRVGTGEITDSLSLDDLTLYSVRLLEYFKKYPKWTLEFKTKSNNVKNFLNLDHAGNIIVSWSLNPEEVIEKEEHGTSSLGQRLNSAIKCKDRQFPIAFHLDPVIYHSNWKENYSKLVEQITSLFSPKEVSHISLGALRFQPEQRHLMRERFGMSSLIFEGELFKSSDGKLKYDQDLRKAMFHFIFSQFKKHDDKWNIFLCMENKENWLGATQNIPSQIENTKSLFNLKTVRQFTALNKK